MRSAVNRSAGTAADTPLVSWDGTAVSAAPKQPPRVAYIMSRFPRLTETFILYEILSLEALGVDVEIYPLLKERAHVVHPEAARLARRAHYHPFVSLRILAAQWYFIRRRPLAYFKVLAEVLAGTFGSANFLVGALGIFPKSVRFALEMSQQRVTHVHAHFATHPAVAALIIHRLTGIPFSFTAHGSDLHVERRMLDKKVEAATFAVTVSQYNREVIILTCGERVRNKVHVIHCGVDPDFFAAPVPGIDGTGQFQIVCIASFEDVKGHRYLVEACRLLRDRGIDLTCHLVGDGPLKSVIAKQVAGARLEGSVRFYGACSRDQVAGLLSSADVMVLASVPTPGGKREGIPVALMEGMASGLPVVASAISGIPELVDDDRSGLLVAPRDAPALADALQRLRDDPSLRARMGRTGRAKIMEQFSLRLSALELTTLFRNGGS